MSEAYLKAIELHKDFGHVQALRGVSVAAYEGEVLAIVGDNGAGKSTLIKILSGVLRPDHGKIKVGDQEYTGLTTRGAIEAGVSTVYQDLALGNTMDVTSNLFLGNEHSRFGFLKKKAMNKKAEELGATNTHFVTPNGLHDENHYTTAYDMYLIFNECIKHQEFMDIISSDSYTADITGTDGTVRQVTWYPTSYYAKGEAALPDGAEVIGGKTGYTGEAGNCLILLDQDESGKHYISIVMGADSKPLLYEDMTAIINQIPNLS